MGWVLLYCPLSLHPAYSFSSFFYAQVGHHPHLKKSGTLSLPSLKKNCMHHPVWLGIEVKKANVYYYCLVLALLLLHSH